MTGTAPSLPTIAVITTVLASQSSLARSGFGTFLERPAEVPGRVIEFVADQLAVGDPQTALTEYAKSRGRWRHGPRIRDQYGYRTFTDFGVAFRLHRFLYALCWTGTDRPSVLFDRAVTSLLASKILLPGLSVLERAVARGYGRAQPIIFIAALSKDYLPNSANVLISLSVFPMVSARARSIVSAMAPISKVAVRSAGQSSDWMRSAPLHRACRQ